MADNRETIAMLKMLKEQALKSHNDTAVLEVKIDSFNFVLDKAIEVLEQQPCEDCISRQAVLDIIMPYCQDDDGSVENTGDLRNALDDIESLPPVTPQPKTGRWHSTTIQGQIDGQIVKAFVCSECGAISIFRMTGWKIINGDLCPNCGARMEVSVR